MYDWEDRKDACVCMCIVLCVFDSCMDGWAQRSGPDSAVLWLHYFNSLWNVTFTQQKSFFLFPVFVQSLMCVDATGQQLLNQHRPPPPLCFFFSLCTWLPSSSHEVGSPPHRHPSSPACSRCGHYDAIAAPLMGPDRRQCTAEGAGLHGTQAAFGKGSTGRGVIPRDYLQDRIKK